MGKKILALMAIPAVLVFGALGFAQQQNNAQPQSAAQAQVSQQLPQAENTKADPDNVQQGDQTSPDRPGQAEEREPAGPDRDNIQQGGGNQVEDGKPDMPGAPAENGGQ